MALVATGFGYDPAVREQQVALVARLLPRVRDIRRLGSAALDLAYRSRPRRRVLRARREGVGRRRGSTDVAAAGLEVLELPPAPPSEGGILVAPGAFAQELFDAVVDA